jgi:hypothetical protein
MICCVGKTISKFPNKDFRKISHVLDNPKLRITFKSYEELANTARDRVRYLGFSAVLTSTIALIALTTRSLWPVTPWTPWLATVVEVGGMLATIILVGGMWFGSLKRNWLENRFMTERLRQWHFQFMIRMGPLIERSCENGPEAISQFCNARDRLLDEFLNDYKDTKDSRLQSIIDNPFESVAWLHKPGSQYEPNTRILKDILQAYEWLRFDKQYDYAAYKLETTTGAPIWKFLSWPPLVQRDLLSAASSACFVGALICAAALILGQIFFPSEEWERYVRTIAIVVAIVGIALRTIEDGLGLDGEIDRYREYRARIAFLYDRFNHTLDSKEQLQLMEGLELAAVEEMQDFLRTHLKARFVLT